MSDALDLVSLTRAAVDTLPRLAFEAWHFGDSVAFEAGYAAGRRGRSDITAFLRGFARGWDARRDGFVEMDATAPGLAIVEMAVESKDEALLATAVQLAEFLVARPKLRDVYRTWERSPLREPYCQSTLGDDDRALLADPGPGVFIDCLHFDPPFFAALHRATGDERWAREALTQAAEYVTLLQDSETGLFWHFYLEHSARTHMLGWGRGQGWALLGLLDVVEQLGADRASDLIAPTQQLIAAMLKRQQPDGSWDAVAGVPASGPETSTAAFMAHGFRRAREIGIVSAAEVDDAIFRALDATVRSTSAQGVLEGVSVAVWASTVDTHYHHVPTGPVTPWGQGPLILALLDATAHLPYPV